MEQINQTTLASTIRERRAVKNNYSDRKVSHETVRALLADAIWAPTHGMREPWRFIYVDESKLPTFAKRVAATYPEDLQENREAYLNEPNAILVVIMETPDNQKQWEENYGATAAMIQNFWLLAWEQKLGVVWKTNPHIHYPGVKELLDVSEMEQIVGFIHLGYFHEAPAKKERIAVEDKFNLYEV